MGLTVNEKAARQHLADNAALVPPLFLKGIVPIALPSITA